MVQLLEIKYTPATDYLPWKTEESLEAKLTKQYIDHN